VIGTPVWSLALTWVEWLAPASRGPYVPGTRTKVVPLETCH